MSLIVETQALALEHGRDRPDNLLDRIAAVVFFSTPHSRSSLPNDWIKVPLIIKAFAAKTKLDSDALPELSPKLASDCRGFETIAKVKSILVLSIYETTGTRTTKLFPLRKHVVSC